MRLRPGAPLRIQHASQDSPLGEVQLLAAVKGQNVMVALKGVSGVQTGLEAGKDYVIRGFSGQYDFTFSSHVTQVFKAPFPYAMLAYPSAVDAHNVRREVRTPTVLPATASPHGKDTPLSVTLADLSMAGAMIDSPSPIGTPGDRLKLEFAVNFDNHRIDLSLPAHIRYINKSDIGGGYGIGVEFLDISQNDKLALHYVAQTYASNNADITLS
ncbi:MAG TPA: PilZ domain-containing protein [Gallionellaceae bacterium]